MPTRIQDLFLIKAAATVATNEDLNFALAGRDASGAAISLDGIAWRGIVKRERSPADAPYLGLASVETAITVPVSVPRGPLLSQGSALGCYVPFTQLARRPIAGVYVADVLASADGVTRRLVDLTLTIEQGVT